MKKKREGVQPSKKTAEGGAGQRREAKPPMGKGRARISAAPLIAGRKCAGAEASVLIILLEQLEFTLDARSY